MSAWQPGQRVRRIERSCSSRRGLGRAASRAATAIQCVTFSPRKSATRPARIGESRPRLRACENRLKWMCSLAARDVLVCSARARANSSSVVVKAPTYAVPDAQFAVARLGRGWGVLLQGRRSQSSALHPHPPTLQSQPPGSVTGAPAHALSRIRSPGGSAVRRAMYSTDLPKLGPTGPMWFS